MREIIKEKKLLSPLKFKIKLKQVSIRPITMMFGTKKYLEVLMKIQ